jgi:hypothetical protein
VRTYGAVLFLLSLLAGVWGTVEASDASSAVDPSSFNIRLSPKILEPPLKNVREAYLLNGYRVGRLGPEAPRAAIIDDDKRQRIFILSTTEEGSVLLYRLAELPIDIRSRLIFIVQCARQQQCRNRRMDPAGEIGCLALCLLESLQN